MVTTESSPWTWDDSRSCEYLNHNRHHYPDQFGIEYVGANYLMIGCGNGDALNAMAREFPQTDFYGIDINADYIQRARHYAPENARFKCIDIADMPPPAMAEFDMIAISGFWSYVSAATRRATLRALFHAKPGARLTLSFNNALIWGALQLFRATVIEACRDDPSDRTRIVSTLDQLRETALVRDNPLLCQFAEHLRGSYSMVKDFIIQPDWTAFYDHEVEADMQGIGWRRITEGVSKMALKVSLLEQVRQYRYSLHHLYEKCEN